MKITRSMFVSAFHAMMDEEGRSYDPYDTSLAWSDFKVNPLGELGKKVIPFLPDSNQAEDSVII